MAKPPVDDLMEAILKAAKAAGLSVGQSEIKTALGSVTKSAGRRAPKAPLKGAAAVKPARTAPKITRSNAAKKPKADIPPLRQGASRNEAIARMEGLMREEWSKPKKATGGSGGKKPPKPPTASAAAPKPSPKPKKPSGNVKKMTRAQKREINVAKHWAERSNYLAESSAKSRAAKEETRAANRAAWAKRQDEMEAKRLAGRKKMKKKEGQ